jgi:hypothetical protein
MFDVDSETLFTAAAAGVSTIAVSIFTLNVELGYSPVSKLLIVGCFLTGVFALTQRTHDRQLTIFGYGVIVVSAVVVFFETVSTFDLGDAVTVVGLLAIATALFLARYALDADNHLVTGQRATYALGLVTAVTVGVLLTDIVTGGLAYELRLNDNTTVSQEHERLPVGSLTATNPTPLPEAVDAPQFQSCTVGNWTAYRPPRDEPERHAVESDIHVDSGYNEHILSYSEQSYPVLLHLRAENITGEPISIMRATECPATDTGAPRVAVFEANTDLPTARPV